MLVKTKGVVLHKTRYSETSIIVKIYTEQLGTRSFIVKNVFSKKNRLHISQFAPLSMLELCFDNKNHHSLLFLKEINRYYHFTLIPFDIARNSILIFYNELLYKLLSDAGEDSLLFDFIETEMMKLDMASINTTDLHLKFMVNLSKILGFFPQNNFSDKQCYFSIEEAQFVRYNTANEAIISKEASEFLHLIMSGKEEVIPPKIIRNELLIALIAYFQIHNEQIKKIESIEILAEVLN
ncbi:MAG: DNA repair protein RecO [Bacteroidales bacterium]